jgi:hypothetical protein
MSARNKLNAAHVNGVLFVAGLLGIATNSGVVFLLAAAILFATSWQAGVIRPPR